MLAQLKIRNFALIDALDVSFDSGLNIISGETGAGKSIIIGAIGLLLGDRASADMIRSGAEAAEVEALFELDDSAPVRKKLVESGIDSGEGEGVIIRRVMSRTGKNKVYINGSMANLSLLSHVGESLMNICSQREHSVMLNEDRHLDMLDAFGDLNTLRSEYNGLFEEWQDLKAKIRQLNDMKNKRLEQEDLARFQLAEIKQAEVRLNEDDQLSAERKVLLSLQKLMEAAGRAHVLLYEREESILASLKNVIDCVRDIRKIDDSLKISESDLESIYYPLEEAAFNIRDYCRTLVPDPDRLAQIEERLEHLGRLKRKYGGSIESIIEKQAELEKTLADLSDLEDDLDKTEEVLSKIESRMAAKAQLLSSKRRQAATALEEAVVEELKSLRMESAEFKVVFKDAEKDESLPFDYRGIDFVEFYLSANAGEDAKPLNRVASGGELSRIILAMKKVLARAGEVGVIVFDEVDSGIGGETADRVGEKLRDVARNHQVLCITHLPQIACYGNCHYRVTKAEDETRTTTRIEPLSVSERLNEIARMLGGRELTETTKLHAREMLERASGG
ncbi:MAG: DNA repair protein RecN [Syntrophus sp. PtaB.Bin001]|nr:MAG: DNA repair protein RecN [Syntrophus sp. PtaB.Bin001]